LKSDILMTVEQLYHDSIKPLAIGDRLQLASLILKGVPADSVVDAGESWSEEDLQDFQRASWSQVDRALTEQENA
jgi:hypothetical protein